MNNLVRLPGIKQLPANTPRTERSIMDTVLLTPDGIDRWSTPPFQAVLRKRCPFVGYGNVRIGGTSRIVLAMSTALRVWFGSSGDTPNPGPSSVEAARMLDENEVRRIAHALTICHEAWGGLSENFRLWGSLNLGLVFWLWRRLVLQENVERKRGGVAIATLTPDQFRLCLLALSANSRFVDWLLGRRLRDRDRSAAYHHVKGIFAGRIGGMGLGRPILPQPEWAGR